MWCLFVLVSEQVYSQLSFAKENFGFYGRKFRFMATRKRSRKTQFVTIKPTIYFLK